MNYLIDTNIISELRKGPRCDPHVADWYTAVEEESIYLSVLTLGELRKGIERIRGRDAKQARALERWLGTIVKRHADKLLPVDQPVADAWGRMQGRRPLSVIDGLLAATAKVYDMTLVTRNLRDVQGLGARVLNPFDALPAEKARR